MMGDLSLFPFFQGWRMGSRREVSGIEFVQLITAIGYLVGG